MNTKTHITLPSDEVLLAYGKEVNTLLSSSSAGRWKEELWTMFDGYIMALQELGHDPDLHHTYFCFRELLRFFEKVESLSASSN
ncbi:hypothetical protein [Dyadobacter sandarakinus]|uniref:Uncharacterized protein n=1 Tax=Dyadobacter sandarakinus TaxID=2747268 RepID=A0ABX7I9J3_9BACT|nr:hypothetical protein [Dyadobacter sandarakinus]QRR02197.1 hypothetical protein HWI92_15435 [Dyadobacter sandarakinus]